MAVVRVLEGALLLSAPNGVQQHPAAILRQNCRLSTLASAQCRLLPQPAASHFVSHRVQDVRRILRALDGVSGTLNATTGPLIVDLSAVALEGCIWQANRKKLDPI